MIGTLFRRGLAPAAKIGLMVLLIKLLFEVFVRFYSPNLVHKPNVVPRQVNLTRLESASRAFGEDTDYNSLYRNEERTGQLFNFFAGIAVAVSRLGLLGLTSFTNEQRTKEIGIRKVLGATVLNITTLLSKDFFKLVAIAIASPFAWFLMDQWLEDFAYKVEIQWWIFLLAGVVLMVTALLTICFQSVKAAMLNPVRSIKAE